LQWNIRVQGVITIKPYRLALDIQMYQMLGKVDHYLPLTTKIRGRYTSELGLREIKVYSMK